RGAPAGRCRRARRATRHLARRLSPGRRGSGRAGDPGHCGRSRWRWRWRMKGYRALPLWLGLLLVSLLVHVTLSWRASLSIATMVPQPASVEAPVDVRLVEQPPPEDELIFEDPIEFELPEILVPLAAAAL